jgi:tetratricopeptide (TPR) repeat protein
MKYIYNPSSFIFIVTVTLSLFNIAIADDKPTDTVLSTDEAEALFEQAMAERDTGKIYNSIEKFEYILSRRPSLNRARLELAVSYERASQYEDAKREFQTVLDDPETPEKVRLAILAYLGQITSDQQKPEAEHSFSYYTKVGALYNSNINFAPLRGSPAYQIPDGEDTASPGLDTFLSASHRYKSNKPFDTAGGFHLYRTMAGRDKCPGRSDLLWRLDTWHLHLAQPAADF